TDKDARSIEDWFVTVSTADASRLPGAFESALLEARAAMEGGLESFTAAQATQLGRSAGQALARLRKKDSAAADRLRADMLAEAGSIGAHAAQAEQSKALAELFKFVTDGLAAADTTSP